MITLPFSEEKAYWREYLSFEHPFHSRIVWLVPKFLQETELESLHIPTHLYLFVPCNCHFILISNFNPVLQGFSSITPSPYMNHWLGSCSSLCNQSPGHLGHFLGSISFLSPTAVTSPTTPRERKKMNSAKPYFQFVLHM